VGIAKAQLTCSQHLLTHADKIYECHRDFVSQSAMVLHLEAGTCESGADYDRVNDIAMACYQAKKYTCYDDPRFNFQCPTCCTPFRFMSALLQHVESENCSEVLSQPRPLAKFLHLLRAWL
jgi:hypothetical protein